MRAIFIAFTVVFSFQIATAQSPKKYTTSEIHDQVKKLNFLGTALFVAAHPDDENTRLISYLSNTINARTAYLSLTRGDGGQNLIGTELRELLGVLRTQELLAARRIDGGEQLFTRANDFGYSKHPDETLAIWNKKEVLADVVWAIRTYKPDVIINRFDHKSAGKTHGHHTSSAMLSVEAFDLVNDAKAYPEQLKHTSVWKPQRLFFNTSWWFYGSRENFEKADKSNMISMDVGSYYPSKGMSNNEIASLASSQHLCQGFGRLATRGSQKEYVELLKGDLPKDKKNIFDGINTTWTRIKGGKPIGAILNKIEKEFNFQNPAVHTADLVKAYQLLQNVKDEHWKALKSKELITIIQAVTGLYIEATTTVGSVTPGDKLTIGIEVLNRSTVPTVLKSIMVLQENKHTTTYDKKLISNKKENLTIETSIATGAAYTNAYWLNKEGSLGMYRVDDRRLIGKPETPRAIQAKFLIAINGVSIPILKDVVYRYSKPDKGELYQPLEIVPEATVSFEDKVLIFADGTAKQVNVTVKSHKDAISGVVKLNYAKGWMVDKESIPFTIEAKGDTKTLRFMVTPPATQDESYLMPEVLVNGKVYKKELVTIAYDHIPTQSILLPTKTKVVRLNIQKAGENIGYIMGAGDAVPESLRQIGYHVEIIKPEAITKANLERFDAVVVGIRAYNVVEELKFKQPFLLDYVKDGGNLIIQYNTAGRWRKQFSNLAPYQLEVSRDRVTDELASVSILAKNHSLMNFPNKIEANDFDGWVQERGLYFPNRWGAEFTPILSMHDKGETAKEGSLLIAPYGKGNYIYTGLSFFRELPVGVSGAYKLFANMLSVGKDSVEKEKIKG